MTLIIESKDETENYGFLQDKKIEKYRYIKKNSPELNMNLLLLF